MKWILYLLLVTIYEINRKRYVIIIYDVIGKIHSNWIEILNSNPLSRRGNYYSEICASHFQFSNITNINGFCNSFFHFSQIVQSIKMVFSKYQPNFKFIQPRSQLLRFLHNHEYNFLKKKKRIHEDPLSHKKRNKYHHPPISNSLNISTSSISSEIFNFSTIMDNNWKLSFQTERIRGAKN